MKKQDILVEIENLVINFYTYNGIVRAIDGVDLIINKGETFGLVGETGCGKSVTAKAIMQLILSPPGKIEDGSVFFLEPGEVRKKRKIFEKEAQKWYDNLPVEKKKEEICYLPKKFMGIKRGRREKKEIDEVELILKRRRIPGSLKNRYMKEKTKRVKTGNATQQTAKDALSNRYDLLKKPDEYMQKIRGRFISMIFQEPMSALNPVITVGDQIAEAILLHRTKELSKRLYRRTKNRMFSLIANNPTSFHIRIMAKLPIINRFNKLLYEEAIKEAVEMLRIVRIPDPEDIVARYPHELSGGMQQRVMIAMALSCNPHLLIADEPTTALDVTIQAQILKLMNDLKSDSERSILLITHNLAVVAETCDRVGVMYAGSMVEIADVRTIFKSPLHPYTLALMKSLPSLKAESEELSTIRGSVPNLIYPPTGCRFHPRCDFATDSCGEEPPQLVEVEKGHFIACHKITGARNHEQ